MRLLLDKCVDARLAEHLTRPGHDVVLIQGLDPSADDRSMLAIATGRSRLLATADLDFGELLVRTRPHGYGVVLPRLEGIDPEIMAARVDAALRRHGDDLPGHLLVADRRRDRLRFLAPPPLPDP